MKAEVFKGSLAIDGISLTVAKIKGTEVAVAIIPHTAEMTNPAPSAFPSTVRSGTTP